MGMSFFEIDELDSKDLEFVYGWLINKFSKEYSTKKKQK